MLNRYANLINILNSLKSNNPNVPQLRADLRMEIEDGNIHEFEFIELMENLLADLSSSSSINMELVENLLHEAEQAQRKENDYEDQLADPMHVDYSVAWNYDLTKNVMVSLLKKRTIRKSEEVAYEKELRRIIDGRQVPADIILLINDLVGDYGHIHGVVKTTDETTMTKRMGQLRSSCKEILRAIKDSEEFDAEFGIEWH